MPVSALTSAIASVAPLDVQVIALTDADSIRVGKVALGIACDLRTGLISRLACHAHYQPHLLAVSAKLDKIRARLPADVSELSRWIGKSPPPARFTSQRLRAAAEAVYHESVALISERDMRLLIGAMEFGSSALEWPDHYPSPRDTRSTFENFSPPLQKILKQQASHIIKTRQGDRYRCSDPEYNPYFLRAAIVSYLDDTQPKSDDVSSGQFWSEVLEWLMGTSEEYQNEFFEYAQKNSSLLNGKEIRGFEVSLDTINRLCGKHFEIGERSILPKNPSEKSRPRAIFFVREAQIDPAIKTLFETLPEPARERILTASGLVPETLLNPRRFRQGLAISLKRLSASLEEGSLEAVSAVLNLFVGENPALPQNNFFKTELVDAGLGFNEQRELVAAVNQNLGKNFEIYHHQATRLLRLRTEATESEVCMPWDQMTEDFQKALNTFSESQKHLPEAQRFRGYALSHHPEWLRFIVIRWLAHIMESYTKSPQWAQDAELAAEFMDWLAEQPVVVQHHILKVVMSQPWTSREGYGTLRDFILSVSQTCHTRFNLRTKCLQTRTGAEKNKYFLHAVPMDKDMREPFRQLVDDKAIRRKIVQASGLSEALLLTPDMLPGGLARAIVTLASDLSVSEAPQKREKMKAIAYIFQMFVGETPLLPQNVFFAQRLVTAGLSHRQQQKLCSKVNRALGTDFQIGGSRSDGDKRSRWQLLAGPASFDFSPDDEEELGGPEAPQAAPYHLRRETTMIIPDQPWRVLTPGQEYKVFDLRFDRHTEWEVVIAQALSFTQNRLSEGTRYMVVRGLPLSDIRLNSLAHSAKMQKMEIPNQPVEILWVTTALSYFRILSHGASSKKRISYAIDPSLISDLDLYWLEEMREVLSRMVNSTSDRKAEPSEVGIKGQNFNARQLPGKHNEGSITEKTGIRHKGSS